MELSEDLVVQLEKPNRKKNVLAISVKGIKKTHAWALYIYCHGLITSQFSFDVHGHCDNSMAQFIRHCGHDLP